MYKIIRPDDVIDDLINVCAEAEDTGISKYPGMTFEDGVLYAIRWLTDVESPHPMED